ncbi:hypothetical protein MLGJGCBP_05081 [Rhodococcus sp. T7]|nr:hypothetical protein MLGJGCBP_05081 [Rhodococcus sp. T7]
MGSAAGGRLATALIGTTLLIAYLSLILGELVPKRIALQRSTEVSLLTAPTLDRFATAMRPVIWLLSASTDLLVRLVGGDPKAKGEAITHEELRDLLIGHTAIAESERRILSEVFDAGRRSLAEVMRPRTDVDFLPAATPLGEARRQALDGGHSRYPVTAASFDDIVGVVHLRDLLRADEHRVATVAELCRPVLQLPASKPALAALSDMRRDNLQIAIVVDEYGGTAGIVTLEDIVEEIVGEIGDEYETTPPVTADGASRPPTHQQVDGLLIIEDFETVTGITLPEGPYETVAGFVLHELQRVPQLGDGITFDGHRLTVSAVDGRRISRVRVTHPRPTADTRRTHVDSERS